MCEALAEPLTGSCPVVTVTLRILPSPALTVTPWAGFAVRAPLAGVMDSAALAAVTPAAPDLPDGWPPGPLDVGEPLEQAAMSRPAAAVTAASPASRCGARCGARRGAVRPRPSRPAAVRAQASRCCPGALSLSRTLHPSCCR